MAEVLTHEAFIKVGREELVRTSYENHRFGDDADALLASHCRTAYPEALNRIELLLLENLRLRNLMSAHLPSEIVVLKNPETIAPGEVKPGSIEDLKSRFGANQVCASKETSGGE